MEYACMPMASPELVVSCFRRGRTVTANMPKQAQAGHALKRVRSCACCMRRNWLAWPSKFCGYGTVSRD